MPFERPDIFRPPSEARSYFLPLTKGCSNNTCTFCGMYGTSLQVREIEEVKKEIDAVALFMKNGVYLPGVPRIVYEIAHRWDGKKLFLQDGDALVYPFPKLKEALSYLREKLPGVERVSTYATPQDILRRTPQELRNLREIKLGIFYMGLESGDDEVLKKIGKGIDTAGMIEAGKKVKDAGIALSVTVILGLGGIEGSRRHALKTAQVLSAMDPDFAGALTVMPVPGTPLHQEWERGEFQLLSPFEYLAELRLMIEVSDFTSCFFSSMHASNYLAVRGTLPQDKEKMLRELDRVLESKNPNAIRPDFMRAL